MIITLLVLLITIGLMIFTRWATDLILAGGLAVVVLLGVIPVEKALSGFSNPGMIAVAILYVVVAGLVETGAAFTIGRVIMGSSSSLKKSLIRFLPGVTISSAFVNNTPIVAMLVPALEKWCAEKNIAPSKVMIPLSYAAILGGTCTLMGTSTNLLVDGLIQQNTNMEPLGFFEIAAIGVPVAIVCLIAMIFLAPWLLPNRQPAVSAQAGRQYTLELSVDPSSSVIGKSIEEAGLRQLRSAFLAEVRRGENIHPAVSPKEILQAGDRLVFVGELDSVISLTQTKGLSACYDDERGIDSHRPQRCMVEAVVSGHSSLVGKKLRDTHFRQRYSAVIVAVGRGNQPLDKGLGDITLQGGDLLLMEARPSFFKQHREGDDFMIINSLEAPQPNQKKSRYTALIVLLLMVVLVSSGMLDLLKGSIVAAALMLITRCTPSSTARRSIDLTVVISIAAAIGLSEAISASGLSDKLAHFSLSLCGQSQMWFLVVIYVLTLTLTLLLTNNAAAVLMFPLALSGALKLGIDLRPVAMVLMMAASASFATPLGYQTNLMVMGPGAYRFTDYLKLGVPLTLIHAITTLYWVPKIWPLS